MNREREGKDKKKNAALPLPAAAAAAAPTAAAKHCEKIAVDPSPSHGGSRGPKKRTTAANSLEPAAARPEQRLGQEKKELRKIRDSFAFQLRAARARIAKAAAAEAPTATAAGAGR
ncbi:unnamed protein product [Prorocentrum cordatum]|uniref:Ribosome biogenesis protein NOP53 n=1 Tax=Prorocentrum cordatum TaxID=2364126 RepID=A0ABN9PIS7_9DINO|nr:unnamed protein product [Polarella glacialis]